MGIRLEAQHRRNARNWMTDVCTVQKYDVATGEWVGTDYPCVVQQSNAQGFRSTPDPEWAGAEETAMTTIYVDPLSDVEVGDRIVWRAETLVVNTAAWRRTEQPYRKVTCSAIQSALVPEDVTFWRITHNQDGEVTGRVDVGTYSIRFTEGPAVTVGYEGGAAGNVREGRILAPLEAAGIVIGDWFDRNGTPGRITNTDHTAPDHIEMTYTAEQAVP